MTFEAISKNSKLVSNLRFPLYMAPCIGTQRCLIIDNKPYTGGLTPIPNKMIKKDLDFSEFNGLDGYLLVEDDRKYPNASIMDENAEFEYSFWVHDSFRKNNMPYKDRIQTLLYNLEPFHENESCPVKIIRPAAVTDLEEFYGTLDHMFIDGYQSVILFDPDSMYQLGSVMNMDLFSDYRPSKLSPHKDWIVD